MIKRLTLLWLAVLLLIAFYYIVSPYLMAILMGGNRILLAKQARVNNDLNAIETQLRIYQEYTNSMPTTEQGLDALVAMPVLEPVPKQWRRVFNRLPEDPWGNPYQYHADVSDHSQISIIYSLGPDIKVSHDDIVRTIAH